VTAAKDSEPGLERHRQDWEDLAAVDLYWSILSEPSKRGGGWSSEEFFESGRAEVTAVLEHAARLGRPDRRRAALDFGCGAGRLTRALASHFDEAVGVDISARMVEEARRLNVDVPGCRFVVNTRPDLRSFEDGAFDLAYSSIVLQHLPSRGHVRTYLSELLRVVSPGGLLVFQLISYLPVRNRIQPRRRLYHALRWLRVPARLLYRARLQPIAMTYLTVPDCLTHLVAAGGEVLETQTVEAGGGVRSTTYFVTVPPGR
jgi:ubiquinone/menaquinone biosynthesis C-methylase UbiE